MQNKKINVNTGAKPKLIGRFPTRNAGSDRPNCSHNKRKYIHVTPIGLSADHRSKYSFPRAETEWVLGGLFGAALLRFRGRLLAAPGRHERIALFLGAAGRLCVRALLSGLVPSEECACVPGCERGLCCRQGKF